jgi:hypothetical protein
MVYPLSCTKLLTIFGKDDQISMLNLLIHIQDPTLNTGWIITQTRTPYYTENLNPAHYNFTAAYMWNNANYTDVTQIIIHSVKPTVNYS